MLESKHRLAIQEVKQDYEKKVEAARAEPKQTADKLKELDEQEKFFKQKESEFNETKTKLTKIGRELDAQRKELTEKDSAIKSVKTELDAQKKELTEKDAEIKVMQDFEEVEQEAREAGFL